MAAFFLVFLLASIPLDAHAQDGFKPAGNYDNTGMLASVSYGPDSAGTQLFVFADRQITAGPLGCEEELDAPTSGLDVRALLLTSRKKKLPPDPARTPTAHPAAGCYFRG